jgi:transcriptional regulator with GAF, ATPase, and Fis domain
MLTIDHRSCNRFSPSIVQFVGTISRLISVSLIQTDASTDLLKRTRVILDERNRLLDENAQVFHDLIGVSPTWMRVLDDIRLVAASELPIFITGETGTGKEQVARTIHAMSTRNQGPFIAVNCSGLVTTLAESELFGHEKGAFTGATTSRRGRFEIADGGTLFLDELGDLPLEIQPKLLRVLQDGIIERVGAEHPLHVDVRIIAATNKNLEDEMTKGNFREDLWYRINVFPIHLPPLRERDHDAILIAQYFLEKIRKRPGYGLVEFSDQAIDKILQIPWYGNVRELRNSIERAAILARGGIIHAEHIISYRDQRQAMHENVLIEKSEIGSLEEIEKHHIEKILMQTNGKIYGTDGAAAILGLKPSTLQSKMKKLGIQRPARS